MIARFHYDRSQLQAFLDEDPSAEPEEIQSHIETCSQCQAELETLAQANFDWDQATRLLGVEPLSPTAWSSQPMVEDNCSSILQSTDHAGSLGRFARYEIMEILGRGGMGVVMRGYDTSLNRHSAIKVLAPELASSAAARKRFSREAKSAAAVVHPHVVPIQTVDEHHGIPYLVMPVVEGKSVDARVRDSGPLSVIETVRIAAQIAEGLAAAHDQGLVHRDIKPANVLLENGVERVQITDFGLARAVDDASMTRSGVIAGTPQYMSPEQAHGDAIDHRSDLFSLGSLIYFMLTGRSPFRAETTMGVLNRIVNDQPRSLQSVNAEVPEWLERIVTKLLSKSPDDRYQTAAEVAAVFQDWHAHLQQPDGVNRPALPAELPAAFVAGSTNHSVSMATDNGSGIGRLPRWLVATAVLALFAFAGAVVYLETSKGTLRIESNADNQVPIVIRQNGKVVDELTVSQAGATARLRAGEYSIELNAEDASIKLDHNQVTIEAGGQWVARIEMKRESTSDDQNRDPSDVRQAAVEDTRNGRHEAALEKILWCWQHGVQAEPSWSAVRRSFLLSDWINLADSSPAALEKLKSIRDELQKRLVSADQPRVNADDFADLVAIHRVLREEPRSIQTYLQLDPRDQQRLYFYLPYCPTTNKPEANNCKQCHRAYPSLKPTLGVEQTEPPKISPFTRMEIEDDRVVVTFDSKQYELLGIDQFPMEELAKKTRDRYGKKWKKRLSEDLVEVFWQLGHFPGETVDLRLRSLETDDELSIKNAKMTSQNRLDLYLDNEHNQPE
ncbi:protein kinase [Stieleria sp. TO1_6]|uniref:serine/threonine-protein kinase n=1 Tax=Stieleria tagensis TaxID=2956795 RepID=UPI00209AFB8B|nr:serine/threonine-protein kinase [Stieleria tagensis]MCO8121335.1 protein kinase [Stieleria tagensis]